MRSWGVFAFGMKRVIANHPVPQSRIINDPTKNKRKRGWRQAETTRRSSFKIRCRLMDEARRLIGMQRFGASAIAMIRNFDKGKGDQGLSYKG